MYESIDVEILLIVVQSYNWIRKAETPERYPGTFHSRDRGWHKKATKNIITSVSLWQKDALLTVLRELRPELMQSSV